VVRETIIEDRLRGGSRDTLEPSPFRRMPLWLGSIAAVVLGLAYYEFVVNAPVNAPTTAPVAPVAPSTAKAGNAEGAGADAAPPLGAVPATAVSATVAPTASESVTPAVEAPARPAALALKKSGDPAGGAASGLHFVFSGESWVEVRDGEGNIVFSRTNEAGSERRVQGKPPLSVVVGGSSRVQLSYNGNPIDLLAYTREYVARLRLE
jgi:cytoskeleton protein RodZ